MEKDFEKEVIERLTKIETKLSNGILKKQDDHEKRIRFLEKGLYAAIGGLAILQIILKADNAEPCQRVPSHAREYPAANI